MRITVDDDGYAEAPTDVPVQFEAAAREAIVCCPERAITEH